MNLDFKNIENDIREVGFKGFYTIKQLQQDYSLIPKVKGVYLILLPDSRKPQFIETGTGGHFKGKNPNVPIPTLEANWIKGSKVVYIGKAGSSTASATLNSRLKQYFNFGQGKPVGHWGGRYIWQLKNSGQLIVCWKPLLNGEPRKMESELIMQFNRQLGSLPYANLTK